MTWTKLPAEFATDPVLSSLPRGIRLLYVEGLVWSNSHGTDGHIPSHMLRRITDEPNPIGAADQLVGSGLWEPAEDGWRIRNFTRDQLSADKVERLRAKSRERQERWRNHVAGDHSGCKHHAHNGVSDGVSNDAPYRTEPTVPSRQGQGTGGNGSDGVAVIEPAPPATKEELEVIRRTHEAVTSLDWYRPTAQRSGKGWEKL